MRNFFSTTPDLNELPSWEADERVVNARARERDLHVRQAHLQQHAKDQRRGGDGSLVTVPSPSHPFWLTQREFEGVYAEWKAAERELQRIERQAQDDAQQAGHDAGYRVWQEEVVPAIERLIASLERLQHVRETAAERTAVRIGDLGIVTLEPRALREFLVQVPRRGVFGTR
jgi:hypothetical protein